MNLIRRRCNGSEGVFRFIGSVKAHPQVWDSTSALDDKQSPAFQEILRELEWQDKITVDVAQQAWKHLKAQYRAEKASCERNGRERSASRWEYSQALSFLDSVKSAAAADRGDTPRRSARYSCAVPSCSNTEKSTVGFRPVRFFDMPDGKDRKMRQRWQQAIPELESAISPAHQKVCELHFVDGRPTDDSPVPTLKLGAPEFEGRASRKRKLLESASPVESNNKTAKASSLQNALHAVAGSAFHREGNHQSSFGASETVALPERHGTAKGGAAQLGQPRLLKLPLKSLGGMAGGKLSTSFKVVASPNGGTARSVILNSKGGHARVIRLVKPSLIASSTPGINCSGGKDALPLSTPQVKTPVAGRDGAASLCGASAEVAESQRSSVANANAVAEGTAESSSGLQAVVKSEGNDEHRPTPSSHNEVVDKPVTLLSALRQTLGPVASTLAGDKEALSTGALQAPSLCKPAAFGHELTCSKCAGELPVLRRSLGRLESRIESMIAMVKTLCTRQAEIENAKKNPTPRPAIVLRPRTVVSTASHSAQGSGPPASSSGITVTPGSGPAALTCIAKNSGGTVVRVDGANGSKLCVVKGASKFAVSAPLRNSTMESDAKGAASGVRAVRVTTRDAVRRSVAAGRSAASHLKPRSPASSAPNLTSVLQQKGTSEHSRSSSPDSEPPSLATRFMPASKHSGGALSYLHKTVIRALLLFGSSTFTVEDFRDEGPTIVRGVATDKLRESLARLVEDGLLHPISETNDLTNPAATYEKERKNVKAEKLAEYGITKEQYLSHL